MELLEKINWKEKEERVLSKNDFLNGMAFEDCSDVQQMLYLTYKKIEELEARVKQLEDRR